VRSSPPAREWSEQRSAGSCTGAPATVPYPHSGGRGERSEPEEAAGAAQRDRVAQPRSIVGDHLHHTDAAVVPPPVRCRAPPPRQSGGATAARYAGAHGVSFTRSRVETGRGVLGNVEAMASGLSRSCHAAERPPAYLKDPAAIYRRSFAIIRGEADLSRFPQQLRGLAVRLAHAAGDISILADLAWSRGALAAGRKALAAGAAILVDSEMVRVGIADGRLSAGNAIVCTLRDPATPELAASLATTRSAAAVERWRPQLGGALAVIGNAPTALFHLLEMVAAGAPKPALVLGFPVGFVGAAEAKAALANFGDGLAYVTLHGRRGGSALAAAAVNALAERRAR